MRLFECARYGGDVETGIDEYLFQVEREHRIVLDNKDSRALLLIDWHMMQTVLPDLLQRICDKRTQFPGNPALPIVDLGCAVDCRLHHASDHPLAKTLAGGESYAGAADFRPKH